MMETHETKNKDRAAFASTDGVTFANDGLTKREYFAGLAMQGILANRELQICIFLDLENDKKMFPNINHQNAIAIHAIREADELIKQMK